MCKTVLLTKAAQGADLEDDCIPVILAVRCQRLVLSRAGRLSLLQVLGQQKVGAHDLIRLDRCTGEAVMQQPSNHLHASSAGLSCGKQ